MNNEDEKYELKYLSQIDSPNRSLYTALFTKVKYFQEQCSYLEYKFNSDLTLGIVYINDTTPVYISSFIMNPKCFVTSLAVATKIILDAYYKDVKSSVIKWRKEYE